MGWSSNTQYVVQIVGLHLNCLGIRVFKKKNVFLREGLKTDIGELLSYFFCFLNVLEFFHLYILLPLLIMFEAKDKEYFQGASHNFLVPARN